MFLILIVRSSYKTVSSGQTSKSCSLITARYFWTDFYKFYKEKFRNGKGWVGVIEISDDSIVSFVKS